MVFAFKTERITHYGDKVYVVGNLNQYGNWNPENGLEMFTNKKSYPLWKSDSVEVNNTIMLNLEYKFVIIKSNGVVVWEKGHNRCCWQWSRDFSTPHGYIHYTGRGYNLMELTLDFMLTSARKHSAHCSETGCDQRCLLSFPKAKYRRVWGSAVQRPRRLLDRVFKKPADAEGRISEHAQ